MFSVAVRGSRWNVAAMSNTLEAQPKHKRVGQIVKYHGAQGTESTEQINST